MGTVAESRQSSPVFPQEIGCLILSQLSLQELGRMSCVSKQWKALTNQDVLWDLRKFFPFIKVIDQKEWKTYFNVENTPLKFDDIEPLNCKKTVQQLGPIINNLTADSLQLKESLTWTLLLLPQNHNARILKEIIEFPKQGNPAKFGEIGYFSDDPIAEPFYKIAVAKTHRVFISTPLIQSACSNFDEQKALVEQIRNCQIPDALTIATYQMFSHVIEGPNSVPIESPITIRSRSCTAYAHPLVVQRFESHCLSVFATRPDSKEEDTYAVGERSIS